MPKLKKRKLKIEKNTRREKQDGQLRDKEGKYTSKEKLLLEQGKIQLRSIKVIKEKGSYGTYIIKQRWMPDDLRSVIVMAIVLGLIVSIL